MTSVSSRHAPFLRFADSPAPSWTIPQDDHQSNEENSSNEGSSTTASATIEHSPSNLSQSSSIGGPESSASSQDANNRIEASSEIPSLLLDNQQLPSIPSSDASSSDIIQQEVRSLPHFKDLEEQVLSDLEHKRVYLFCDYDGTLTPIVDDPCKASLPNEMRSILFNLANSDRVSVSIVTGRALHTIKKFIQIAATEELKFLYAASHGFHIEAAGNQLHHQVGAKFIPVLREAALKISSSLGHIPGISLEDNEFAVTVHFRNVPPEFHSTIEETIDQVLSAYPSLKKTKGKMVYELRINLSWNKGSAVMWLLQAMNVDPEDPNVRLVYIGDDLTDEDAFKLIRQFEGNHHLAILVSDSDRQTQSSYTSRSTAASFFVKDTNEVAEFLMSLERLMTSTSSNSPSSSSLSATTPLTSSNEVDQSDHLQSDPPHPHP